MRVHGVEAGEHHGFDFFKAGKRFEGGVAVVGDGVADFRVGNILDVRDEESDFAGFQLVNLDRLGILHAESFGVEGGAIRPQTNSLALAQGSFKDADQHDDAAVSIEPGVENQGLQAVIRIAFWGRNALHDGFQHVGHALAGFGADEHSIGSVKPDGAFDHFFGARDVGALQINLVDDGNNFEAVVDGEVGVGEGLRFHSLGSVDDEQGPFAGGERARDFVGEVDVAGSVDEVELVSLTVVRGVHHAHGMGLDGDAALAFQVHGVEHLRLHLARGERAGQLQQAVRQRGFTVVDMRDDGEVAEESGVHRIGCQRPVAGCQ